MNKSNKVDKKNSLQNTVCKERKYHERILHLFKLGIISSQLFLIYGCIEYNLLCTSTNNLHFIPSYNASTYNESCAQKYKSVIYNTYSYDSRHTGAVYSFTHSCEAELCSTWFIPWKYLIWFDG